MVVTSAFQWFWEASCCSISLRSRFSRVATALRFTARFRKTGSTDLQLKTISLKTKGYFLVILPINYKVPHQVTQINRAMKLYLQSNSNYFKHACNHLNTLFEEISIDVGFKYFHFDANITFQISRRLQKKTEAPLIFCKDKFPYNLPSQLMAMVIYSSNLLIFVSLKTSPGTRFEALCIGHIVKYTQSFAFSARLLARSWKPMNVMLCEGPLHCCWLKQEMTCCEQSPTKRLSQHLHWIATRGNNFRRKL